MSSLKSLPTRPLGRNGPLVPRLGLGLMGASGVYGSPAGDEERLAFLSEAYERGERFWDTGKIGNQTWSIRCHQMIHWTAL